MRKLLKRLFVVLVLALIPVAGCTVDEGFTTTSTVTGSAGTTVPAFDLNEAVVDTEVTFSAYLYSGPGRVYEQLGSTFPGKPVQVVGRDATGDWYQLADRSWIAAIAVDGNPDVPIVTEITGRITARVLQVFDGDTIEVGMGGESFLVRYLISNAPDPGQTLGAEATEANRSLVAGQLVFLEQDVTDVDAYGRALRYVYLSDGKTMINEEMVRLGYAQVAVFPPDRRHEQRLREAQAQARADVSGLWAQKIIPFQETEEGCTYTVQEDDSLFIIGRRFGILVPELAEANGLENPDFLSNQQVLVLPGCRSALQPPEAPPTVQSTE